MAIFLSNVVGTELIRVGGYILTYCQRSEFLSDMSEFGRFGNDWEQSPRLIYRCIGVR